MKELMLGNKAVARGLYEAGCCVISSYPGTPSTEITEEAAKYPEIYCEWAPNEKVALEVAHGAAVGGKRAACCMKHVGLNVAADPLFTISYQGVEAGLVICVADDPGMFSSQNEQDSRHYAIAAKVPMLEPSDSQEALTFAKEAFRLSEEYHTPVLLRMCTRISHSQSIVERGVRQEVPAREYVKDPLRVMMTTNSLKAHYRVEARTKAMTELAETSPLNRLEMGEDTSLGIITSSTSYQYVREVFGEKACVLKLGLSWPMPVQKIRDFAAQVGQVLVVEELEPIIENHCRQIGVAVTGKEKIPLVDELTQGVVARSLGREALTFAKEAFRLSEEYHTPVLLRMCTRISHSQSIVERGVRQEVPAREYVKDPLRVMMTTNSLKAHYRVEARTKAMTELAETSPLNRLEMGEDTSLGIITSSTSYQYVREVFGEKACVLKLGLSWPMPVQKIRDFAAQVGQVLVVEELEPIIENHCRQIGVAVTGKEKIPLVDELTQGVVARSLGREAKPTLTLDDPIPGRPPVMCAGCPHRGVFYTLSKNKCMVYGDIGCYTLGVMPPLNAMDLNVCMGASCSGLHGFNLAGGEKHEKHSVAVIGDSTFAHSGITGIADIAYNRSNSTVIILDNSITGMTGHQQNPTTGKTLRGEPAGKIDLEALCRAVGFARVRVVDPNQLKEMDRVLKEELAAEEPSVIITRSPCVMLKDVPKAPPLKVDADKCNGCSLCMRIGCPALSLRDGKAEIDRTQCIGCQVCMQMCHRNALIV